MVKDAAKYLDIEYKTAKAHNKGVEMLGYIFTIERVVVALASVATAICAYGFYELHRRSNSSKKKVDVSDVIDRHFCKCHEHQCGDHETVTNIPEVSTSTFGKLDSPFQEYQHTQGSCKNKKTIDRDALGDSVAPNAETPNTEVSNGLLDGINIDSLSDGFRELLENRVVVLRSIENDEDEWGLKVVDLYEELQRLLDSSFEEERDILNAMLLRIATELEIMGFVRIKLSEWNPEYQNAVVVTQGECSERIKVIDSISSGVIRNGKVLRKQEVSVLIPKKEN